MGIKTKVSFLTGSTGTPCYKQMVIMHSTKETVDEKLFEELSYTFQSYESIIAIWDCGSRTITFGPYWNYSVTTAKYLYKFLNERGISNCVKSDIEKALKTGTLTTDKGIVYKVIYDENLS